MKTINKTLGALALLGLVGITGCENKTEVLKNPTRVSSYPIPSKAMYSLYAKELREKFPQLKKIDKRDVEWYLQYDLNGGRNLFAGETVNLPEYDSQ